MFEMVGNSDILNWLMYNVWHTNYTAPYKDIWLFSVNENTEAIYPTSLEFENFTPLFLPVTQAVYKLTV